MANLELREELEELIEDLTTSGSPSLKADLMKEVKRICKSSDNYVKHAYHILMTQLKKKHAEVRLSAFQIINELFQRSHIFRDLLLGDFPIFLELTAETDFKQPLPPPTNVAKTLLENMYRTVEAWHQKFGSHYKNLDLGFKYLKRAKCAELDNLRSTDIAERHRAEERERRKHSLLRKKLIRVESQMAETVPDIGRCLTERESCFKLLLPHPSEYEVHISTGADSENILTTELDVSAGKKVACGGTSSRTLKEKCRVDPTECSDENSQAAECKDNTENTVETEGYSNGMQTNTTLFCIERGRSDGDGTDGSFIQLSKGSSDCRAESFYPPEGAQEEEEDRDDINKECISNDSGSQEKGPQPGRSSQLENDEEVEDDEPQGILTRHGLGTRSYQLSIDLSSTTKPIIHETDDNSVILDKLRESNKEITHKYLPMINKWLSVLSKCDGMQLKIQQVIDMKRPLEASRDKFLELQVVPMEKAQEKVESSTTPQSSSFVITGHSEDEDSEDDFQDVPEKEGLEFFIPSEKRAEYGLEPVLSNETISTPDSGRDSTLSQEKPADSNDCTNENALTQCGPNSHALADPTSRERALVEMKRRLLPGPLATVTSDSLAAGPHAGLCQPPTEAGNLRQRLLQEAPVLPFDADLYFWGDPTAGAHKIVKSNVGNNHWASKEDEGEFVVEGEERGLQKRTMTFAGKFVPVRWACRAPLPSGQLCPRRDRFKCPFHGKIVARDKRGCPVELENAPAEGVLSGEGAAAAQPDWREIQEDIEAATGLDLGGKRGRKRTPKEGGKLTQKQKYARLTDLKKNKHTSHTRLKEKVLNPKAMKRVAEDVNTIASKKHQEKFGNQFNYAMRK